MIWLLLSVLLLTGCAQYRWLHPNYTEATFKRDAYDCEKDMRQSAHFGTGIAGAINAREFQERCMEARGYTKTLVESPAQPNPPPPTPADIKNQEYRRQWCQDPESRKSFPVMCKDSID